MARKKKRQSRPKFRGINVTNTLEAYSQVAVWSEAIVETNPIDFAFGSSGGATTSITARELLDSLMGGAGGINVKGSTALSRGDTNAFDVMATNLKDNWLNASFKSIGLGVGWRFGRKATAKPRRYANKLIKDFGLGDLIKF